MKTLFRALLATLLLTPSFAGAQSHLSSDPAVVQSRVLVMNGRFDAALAVLRPLDREGPGKVDILFLTGIAAMGAAEAREDDDEREALLDEAIAALRAILIDRPELTRVRLELARALFLTGADRPSRDQFERVLAGGPAPPVVANINRYLAQIRKRRRWTSYFGGSIAEDSNLGAASDSEFIYIFGLPFRRNEESLATSGTGLVVWGALRARRETARAPRDGARPAPRRASRRPSEPGSPGSRGPSAVRPATPAADARWSGSPLPAHPGTRR